MDKQGPILIIEDDKSDQKTLIKIFKELNFKNEVSFFDDGQMALDFLNSTDKIPFIILSDINMPRLDGFQLREKIRENKKLSLKCVPFLFFSTGADKDSVEKAYSMSVQGFFRKPYDTEDLGNTMRKIIEYWKECIAPGDYNE